ncbi:Flp family type IVb pilin [Blastococcus saxobsidens]|uniref:Pilus subunit protein PilA n=1 Tax=Blastococcus saxobsidens (strain DD2) TaxID=1146883 RepID=H6RRS6_BLASD|nr:Flp family type IVb pilin [Blastococcus saxobsidens]CCG02920.1 Pilus subunit protein PilA [Blastococcus saxobsidens DD2]
MINPIATIATLIAFAQTRMQREEKGATAVEYGLMVGLIAAVIIATVVTLGGQLNGLFQQITTQLGTATP